MVHKHKLEVNIAQGDRDVIGRHSSYQFAMKNKHSSSPS
jgi:hypothetical protein